MAARLDALHTHRVRPGPLRGLRLLGVVTVTIVYVPTFANASNTARSGQPKVKETTGTGSSRRMASLAS